MNFIDLGQVSALRISSVAPTNTKLLWYDTNITSGVKVKYYEEFSQTWQLISGGSNGSGSPVTFIELQIAANDKEVILPWSPSLIAKHGTRPVDINLYEIGTDHVVKSKSDDYTEDNGATYRWFVNTMSPRKYEIRIHGFTNDPLPILVPPVQNTIVFNKSNESSS